MYLLQIMPKKQKKVQEPEPEEEEAEEIDYVAEEEEEGEEEKYHVGASNLQPYATRSNSTYHRGYKESESERSSRLGECAAHRK